MKKVSFISPLRNESELLDRGLKEFESFIQKFPLQWELILVIDPSSDSSLEKAKSLQSEKIKIKVLENKKPLGRGPSVLKGLQNSTGDYMLIFPLDFTIPLAELFQFLQEVILNPKIDLAFGNRNTSRKKWEAPLRTSWHWTLEKIIVEKLRLRNIPVQDPLCPYLIIQRNALEKLLPKLKLKSWYYTPEIVEKSKEIGLQITEVPILSRDPRPSKIPILREYLKHLF